MATLARFRWLVAVTVLGSLVGFLGSYLLSPRYSARAVLVESLPSQSDSRMPVGKSASRQRLDNYLGQAFCLKNLRPRIEREGIAKAEEVENVFREIRKNTKLQPEGGGDPLSPGLSADLIYTDSTPQRAEQLCGVLTSAALEKTRVDDEEFRASNVTTEFSHGPAVFIGPDSHPYGVDVVFPCGALGTPDISHPLLCAAIGSATGLLVGIALIVVRRTSLAQLAEPRC